MSDVAKTPREELECKKKYLYEHSMFWECNGGSKCQILEDDVVDLLNKQDEKINEQESIIRRDETSIQTMMSNMKKLEEENKELNLVNEKLGKMLDANYKTALELESEVCLLNAFLVEQGLAEEYIRWKGDD